MIKRLPRILFADDNAEVRQYVKRMLGGTYEIELVCDGEAALTAGRQNPPDLLIADVMMPRLDGFGLLKSWRHDPRLRHIPVILLSARRGEEPIGGLAAGATDYLAKPFSARGLRARVNILLENARENRAAFEREHELRKSAEEREARTREELRHADRLATIGQLAAGMAHELNEPLANILGFAQLAKKEPGMPSTAASDLDKIINTSLHAREIIRKLLVFCRQMPLHKTQVNLNRVVEEGLNFLESRCAKAGLELVRSLEPALPEINADPSQLQQVLVNLVVNAIQASPSGGKLTIETHRGRDYVSLAVADTGTGMTEQVKSKIFTPFFTTKHVNQGTGLGLAVVHGIVTSHRGVIHVESEVGRGSRFEVQLPLNGSGKAEKSG